jgi:hypothetical protein
LATKRTERCQGNEDRYEECGATKGAIEAAAPPRYQPPLVSTTPNDVRAQERQKHQHYAEELAAKTRSAGNFRQ